MGENRPYGNCNGCGKWIPREEMRSINVDVYGEDGDPRRIRIRSCESCHIERASMFAAMQWSGEMKREIEIITDPRLAANSDLEFDGSKTAMRMLEKCKSTEIEAVMPWHNKQKGSMR